MTAPAPVAASVPFCRVTDTVERLARADDAVADRREREDRLARLGARASASATGVVVGRAAGSAGASERRGDRDEQRRDARRRAGARGHRVRTTHGAAGR